MGNFFKKYGPSLLAVGSAVLPIFYQPISSAIAAHPNVAAALFAAYSILAHVLPSPNQVAAPKP